MFILIGWRKSEFIDQVAQPEVIGAYESRLEAEESQRTHDAEFVDFNIKEVKDV